MCVSVCVNVCVLVCVCVCVSAYLCKCVCKKRWGGERKKGEKDRGREEEEREYTKALLSVYSRSHHFSCIRIFRGIKNEVVITC